MTKDYYVSLCQRKIRKIEKRIELGKKHPKKNKSLFRNRNNVPVKGK